MLAPIVRAVAREGWPVVWVCDPMHGNTMLTPSGVKTRRIADVLAEIRGFFAVHQREGTVPGGIHLELTPHDVTECLGPSDSLDDRRLDDRSLYRTMCDPRLNARQSLGLAFELGELLQSGT